MIVRELLTRLGFTVNPAGAARYEAQLASVQHKANAVASNMTMVFARAAGAIAAAIAAAAAPRAIARAGDEMQTSLQRIESSIGRSATSAEEAARIYEQMHQAGIRTGVGANESAQAFTRFNLAMQDLGRPASDTVTLLEGIQSAGVVAGTTTAELTAAMMQLGQALAGGVLSGDELKTMREAMPRFLRDTAAAMNMTTEEFIEKAKRQELTPRLLIPALMAASRTAAEELARMPVGMARAYSALTNVAQRFSAELDKQLGLSKLVAEWFVRITKRIEDWQKGLDIVGQYVQRLGGLQTILGAVAYSFGIATVAAAVFFRAAIAGAVAATAPWLAIVGVIALAGAMLQDIALWMSGADADTLMGEWFGPFNTIGTKIRTAVQEFFAPVGKFFSNIAERLRAMDEQFKAVFGSSLRDMFSSAFSGLRTLADEVLGGIIARLETISAIFRTIRSWFPEGRDIQGSGRQAPGEPLDTPMHRRRAEQGLPVPDVQGRLHGAIVNAPTTATVNNDITINAPGADSASVADATQRGVDRGMATFGDIMRGALGVGRWLGIANPRMEPARQ
jgi:tape measure domain-containing protein